MTGLTRVTLLSGGALYLAASLFGLAIGFHRGVVGDIGPGSDTPQSVLVGSVVVVIYGMTVSGHVLWLWPLALATSLFVRSVSR